MERLRLKIDIWETAIERIPQCVLQLSLMFASIEYKRLLLVLPNFGDFLELPIVFIVVCGSTFWGILSTLIRAKYFFKNSIYSLPYLLCFQFLIFTLQKYVLHCYSF